MIQSRHTPPFSIDTAIDLEYFSYEEALPLAQGLRGKTSNSEKLLREVLWWTGGQPFLTQKICYLIQKSEDYVSEGNEKLWLEELIRNRVIDNWKFQDAPHHFGTIESIILANEKKVTELLRAYRAVLLEEEYSEKNIKAPHQMGKTSLLHKILDYAKKQNYMTVLIDFQSLDRSIFENLETFLKWFSLSITNSLNLPNKMDEYWDNKFRGSRAKCSDYFEGYILNEGQTPLILCLDEFSLIFDYPDIAGDFLPLLRGWHEESKISKQWRKLRLVLSLSTKVYSSQPIHTSPFNVGYAIQLPEFDREQVKSLVRAYGINLGTSQVDEIMNAIGGHPYLIQVVLKAICDQDMDLKRLLETAPTEEEIYRDHLRQKLLTLEQYPELKDALKKVIAQENPIRLESVLAYKLEALGLVVFRENKVTIRNNLYRSYFRDILFTS